MPDFRSAYCSSSGEKLHEAVSKQVREELRSGTADDGEFCGFWRRLRHVVSVIEVRLGLGVAAFPVEVDGDGAKVAECWFGLWLACCAVVEISSFVVFENKSAEL